MPYALCPMPYALCPMPYALCPMPYPVRVPHLSEKGYIFSAVRLLHLFRLQTNSILILSIRHKYKILC